MIKDKPSTEILCYQSEIKERKEAINATEENHNCSECKRKKVKINFPAKLISSKISLNLMPEVYYVIIQVPFKEKIILWNHNTPSVAALGLPAKVFEAGAAGAAPVRRAQGLDQLHRVQQSPFQPIPKWTFHGQS